MLWTVSYTFDPGVPVAGPPPVFTGRGPLLKLDGTLLVGVEHEVSTNEGASEEDATAQSRQDMDLLILALRYRQLKPVHWWVKARSNGSPGISLSVRGTGIVGPRPAKIPTAIWRVPREERLRFWLQTASEANEASSAATALRLYFLIIEDHEKTPGLGPSVSKADHNRLKALRDFVSHPAIHSDGTQKILESELGIVPSSTSPLRFDPHSAAHQAILETWRGKARVLIESLLEPYFD